MSDAWSELKVTDSMEAEILKAALESVDIPVVLVGEAVGRIYGITASALGSVHVLVPPDRVDEARELVETSRPVDYPEGD